MTAAQMVEVERFDAWTAAVGAGLFDSRAAVARHMNGEWPDETPATLDAEIAAADAYTAATLAADLAAADAYQAFLFEQDRMANFAAIAADFNARLGDAAPATTARHDVASGHYTVVFPQHGSRVTLKLSPWKADTRRPDRTIRWIGYLSGPNNEHSYTTFAMQFDTGEYRVLPKWRDRCGAQLSALRVVLDGSDDERNAATTAYAVESGNCARCNRLLTVPGWEDRFGLGPECFKKLGI